MTDTLTSMIVATALLIAAMAQRSFVVAVAYSKTDIVQLGVYSVVLLGEQLSSGAMLAIVLSTVGVLLRDGQTFLGGVVLVFSVLLPVTKLLYLLLVSTLPPTEIVRQHRRLRALEWLGKWSMHDVLVLALGKPIEQVVLEPIGTTGSTRYYRDAAGIHHVPKRALEEIIVE